MVRDLNFAVEIVAAPIVRESDGLACSSRNQYLNPAERKQATVLHAACLAAVEAARNGARSAERIVSVARSVIASASLARVAYVELVDVESLQPLEVVSQNALLALAVFFGKTRLIDNIRLP
jgi:pantoate--beta-alanine ligase